MSLMRKIAVGVVLALIVVPAASMAIVFWFGGNMCGNYVYREYSSPDKSHKAVVFQRDCGATTGFSTQISIIGAEQEIGNSKGNIYIIDGHPEEVAPTLKWHSDRALLINRPLSGTEYRAEANWGWINKIKVEYDAASS